MHRVIATVSRWPTTASPFDHAPLASITPERISRSIVAAISSISGDAAISSMRGCLVARSEGTVKPYSRNSVAIGRESQEEQRHAGAVLELATVQRLFETVTSIDALGSVKVGLPEVWAFDGMVPFKANAGGNVNEACAVTIPSTNYVSQWRPSQRDEVDVTIETYLIDSPQTIICALTNLREARVRTQRGESNVAYVSPEMGAKRCSLLSESSIYSSAVSSSVPNSKPPTSRTKRDPRKTDRCC